MLSKAEAQYYSTFPTSLWRVADENIGSYRHYTIAGYEIMAKSTCIIAGCARNVSAIWPLTEARIEKLGGFFEDYHVIIYTNDNDDDTLKQLDDFYNRNCKVDLISENLKKQYHGSVISDERTVDMAYYRNQYLNLIKECSSDYVIIADMDLEGGWCYEGIANSIGHDLDVVGSNGLLYRENNGQPQKLYFDAYAYRALNHPAPHDQTPINLLQYNRGELPIQVFSCFGGMAIYKRHCLKDWMEYKGNDCDHPTLHQQMREAGFKIWLNPSQIILYSKHHYYR